MKGSRLYLLRDPHEWPPYSSVRERLLVQSTPHQYSTSIMRSFKEEGPTASMDKLNGFILRAKELGWKVDVFNMGPISVVEFDSPEQGHQRICVRRYVNAEWN